MKNFPKLISEKRILKITAAMAAVLLLLACVASNAESKGLGIIGGGIKGGKGYGSTIEADTMMDTIKLALEEYKIDNRMYPTTEQGLKALVKKTTVPPIPLNWRGPYLGRLPLGPEKNPFNYTCPGVYNKNGYDLSY